MSIDSHIFYYQHKLARGKMVYKNITKPQMAKDANIYVGGNLHRLRQCESYTTYMS